MVQIYKIGARHKTGESLARLHLCPKSCLVHELRKHVSSSDLSRQQAMRFSMAVGLVPDPGSSVHVVSLDKATALSTGTPRPCKLIKRSNSQLATSGYRVRAFGTSHMRLLCQCLMFLTATLLRLIYKSPDEHATCRFSSATVSLRPKPCSSSYCSQISSPAPSHYRVWPLVCFPSILTSLPFLNRLVQSFASIGRYRLVLLWQIFRRDLSLLRPSLYHAMLVPFTSLEHPS